MIAGSIARRYAKALLQLGVAGGSYQAFGAELSRFVRLLADSGELRGVLISPIVPVSKRKAIVADVLQRLGTSRTVTHFLLLLLDRNRMPAVEAIEREYGALCDLEAGRVRAVVTSAQPLDGPAERRIQAALALRTGKDVILEKRVDPSLLAGVAVRIGDVIYDGSARAGLARLRDELHGDEASRRP